MNLKERYIHYVSLYFFYYFSMSLFTVVIPVYILDKGFDTVDLSIAMSASLIASFFIQPIFGYFNDMFNQKKVNTVGLVSSMFLQGFL